MSLLSFLYLLYLRLLAVPCVVALYIVGWKRQVLRENARRCGIPGGGLFRVRFYFHAATDLLSWIHGPYGRVIQSRPRDATQLKKLKSSGGLFLTGHFHHWEAMGAWMTREGVPLLSAARPLNSPWAQALLSRLRSRQGMRIAYRDLPRTALRHLDGGGCFALLWDQRVPRSETIAPLFGIPLRVDPLPGFLLRHRSIPIWFGVLLPGGRFRLLSLGHSPTPGLTGLSADRLARRYHRVLEVLVRRHPTWWYGLAHRRFKDAPDVSSGTKVSRETSAAPGVMVSRETKLSA